MAEQELVMFPKIMYKAMVNSLYRTAIRHRCHKRKYLPRRAKLPDAPNLATIGIDENAETILYTGKDSTFTRRDKGIQGQRQHG